MKNLFATDETGVTKDTDADDIVTDGDFLVVSKIRAEDKKRYDELDDETLEIFDSSIRNQNPGIKESLITILACLPLFVSFAILAGAAQSEKYDSLFDALFSPPNYWGIIIIVLLGISAVLFVFQKKLKKASTEAAETEGRLEEAKSAAADKKLDEFLNAQKAARGIPHDAEKTELLAYSYTVKNGAEEVKEISFSFIFRKYKFRYTNTSYYHFSDSENFYISDEFRKLAIHKSSLKYARVIETPMELMGIFGEAEEDEKEKYTAPYTVIKSNGQIHIDRYISVVFEINGEEYCIWYPPYEADVVRKFYGVDIDIKTVS